MGLSKVIRQTLGQVFGQAHDVTSRALAVSALALSLAPATALAQAAGTSEIAEPNPLRHNIVLNGTLATNTTAPRVFTVSLEMVSVDGAVTSTCTGVIIAKDIVLSAGHCFKPTTALVRVRFGLGGPAGFQHQLVSKKFLWDQPEGYLAPSSGPGLWTDGKLNFDQASQATFESEISRRTDLVNYFETKTVDEVKLLDLAVIQIDSLPAGYGPVKIFTGQVSYGMPVLGIGYGTNSRTQSEIDGRLRWTNLNVVGHYTRPGEFTTAWQVYSKERKLTCFGDSGGPLFVKSGKTYELLGTLLFVYNSCADSAFYLNPNVYMDRINEHIRAVRAMTDT